MNERFVAVPGFQALSHVSVFTANTVVFRTSAFHRKLSLLSCVNNTCTNGDQQLFTVVTYFRILYSFISSRVYDSLKRL